MIAGTKTTATRATGRRWAMWGAAAALLMLPALAMQVTDEVRWDARDFATLAAMLGIAGGLVELAVRASADRFYHAGAGVAVLAGFGLVWTNLAVGMLGDERNPANLLFAGVLAVAAGGAGMARGRARGLAKAMAATAVAQGLAGAIGLTAGWASPGADGVYEVAMGTTLFGGLWLVAAALFRRSGQ